MWDFEDNENVWVSFLGAQRRRVLLFYWCGLWTVSGITFLSFEFRKGTRKLWGAMARAQAKVSRRKGALEGPTFLCQSVEDAPQPRPRAANVPSASSEASTPYQV